MGRQGQQHQMGRQGQQKRHWQYPLQFGLETQLLHWPKQRMLRDAWWWVLLPVPSFLDWSARRWLFWSGYWFGFWL
jgi:hypothetical protein